jgi:hypothetical protein
MEQGLGLVMVKDLDLVMGLVKDLDLEMAMEMENGSG